MAPLTPGVPLWIDSNDEANRRLIRLFQGLRMAAQVLAEDTRTPAPSRRLQLCGVPLPYALEG